MTRNVYPRLAAAAASVLVLAAPGASQASAPVTPAAAQSADTATSAGENGRRTRCNGGGRCCDNHETSLACQTPEVDCLVDPLDPACVPV